MSESLVSCPKCRAQLLDDVFNKPDWTPCPACHVPLQIEVFPALFHPPAVGSTGERIVVEGEASCFYHPQKKAVVPCEGCGRFLCGLCDVELNGQHLCPTCLESGKKKGKLKNLQNQRTCYDTTALVLSLVPLTIIFWFFTFVTAPMALFIAIRYWNAPGSLVRGGSRARFVIAIILSSLQIVGWVLILVAAFTD
jgi:hypothetical protein